MLTGRVIRPVICQSAIPGLRGLPLVEIGLDQGGPSATMIAVDAIGGAAVGASVLIAEGDAARLAVSNDRAPIEAAVVGLLD